LRLGATDAGRGGAGGTAGAGVGFPGTPAGAGRGQVVARGLGLPLVLKGRVSRSSSLLPQLHTSPEQPGPPRGGASPSQSARPGVRSLLAADLRFSRQLGVCAGERSAWGSARPLLRLLEVSGHGVPWLAGTLYGLGRSESPAGREVLLNLLFALVLDLVLVAMVKGLVRRRRPTHNKMDMFVTISVDKYSFPSGHATRAAMVCRFVLHHLVLAIPLRVLMVLWAIIVGISRVMLGRHNVTDVAFGFIMGYMQYNVVKYFWLSPLSAPALFAVWNQ
uniref:Polyisoprenoid diphosphate/phosphate phosphohydrolase PLPP6 n=1 Tax=Chelonoidis abingdonii TaxID=106734 RepID=A0A8C0IVV9_CHEAB